MREEDEVVLWQKIAALEEECKRLRALYEKSQEPELFRYVPAAPARWREPEYFRPPYIIWC